MSDSFVLVIGTSCLDIKGSPSRNLQQGVSVQGRIRASVGGVGRNIAENLARLGVPTVLLSAVGEDRSGHRIMTQAFEVGVDIQHVKVEQGMETGAYIALLNQDGSLAYGLDDTRIAHAITPQYIYNNRSLFRDADMVILDASLPSPTLKTAFRLARNYQVPVCADPTASSLAKRLCPYLGDLVLVTPNIHEAEALVRQPIPADDPSAVLAAAKQLVSLGCQIVVITMAEEGLCYATNEESGFVPALHTEVADLTGGGDALTAAIVFAALNDIPISEAMRLGCSAASLTIACTQTVVPDLTLELLYENLSV
jgi:pseudouridine kinase